MTSMTGTYSPMSNNTGSNSRRNARTGDVTPSGYRSGQLQQFTPEQMELFQQMFSHAGPDSYLSRLAGGDQSMFDEMEAPAFRQFNEQIGGLSSRFSGMGGLGARKSSGFQNTANAATSNFAQDLQSQRQNLQRQAIQDLMGISNQLLGQRPQERFLTEKRQKPPGFWHESGVALAKGFGEGAGRAATAGFGGGG